MNIVIVDNGGPIPALKYGGTERVIWGLGKKLSGLKHKVTFLVPEGSYCDFADLIYYNQNQPIEDQIPEDTEIIHVHFKLNETLRKPYVITIHGNYSDNEPFDKQSIFLSQNHAHRHNSNVYVHNGLDWEDYPQPDLNLERRHYHFLGKASWKTKNALGAYSIAHKTKFELKVLGGKRWNEYNIKNGLKYILNPRIEFMGMVGDNEKRNICSRSKGLIFPVRWHEPFGLAVIESLFYGCPVFATPYGALQELVKEEVGFISNKEKDLINAIKNNEYDVHECHQYARDCFNADLMTEKYLELYEKALNGESLNASQPYLINPSNLSLQDYHF